MITNRLSCVEIPYGMLVAWTSWNDLFVTTRRFDQTILNEFSLKSQRLSNCGTLDRCVTRGLVWIPEAKAVVMAGEIAGRSNLIYGKIDDFKNLNSCKPLASSDCMWFDLLDASVIGYTVFAVVRSFAIGGGKPEFVHSLRLGETALEKVSTMRYIRSINGSSLSWDGEWVKFVADGKTWRYREERSVAGMCSNGNNFAWWGDEYLEFSAEGVIKRSEQKQLNFRSAKGRGSLLLLTEFREIFVYDMASDRVIWRQVVSGNRGIGTFDGVLDSRGTLRIATLSEISRSSTRLLDVWEIEL